jgi:hypothetical protein
VAFLASAFKTTFFNVQCNYMEDLKPLLIDRLKSQGMDPSLIPAFLKTLTGIISSKPGIELAQVNQKLNLLGWDEVTIDYHSLQIAMACLVTDVN